MMKRIIIGLIAIGGVALWWTDARAQCVGGVGIGGSCKTGGLLGRSLVGITRTLEPGTATFEFFGTKGPNCNHKFSKGVLDCGCRLKGTAYCTADVGPSSSFTASKSNEDDDDDDGDDDDGDGADLVAKHQTLPAGLQVLTAQPVSTPSPGGNQGVGTSFFNVAEAEPAPGCVQCPPGAPEFVTFIADAVVVRDTFMPSREGGKPHTTIRVCRGGRGINPTTIESYNCQTVFECEGEACPYPSTSGYCTPPACAGGH